MHTMQEHTTFPGKVYAVTCASGCTITDNKGRTLGECEAGKQTLVVATSDKLLTSADALVTATFNFAPAKLRALGLIGGGVSALPAGYLAAEFLESTGTQYIDTGLKGINPNSFVFFEGVLTGSVAGNGSRAFHAPGWAVMAASGGGRIFLNTPNSDLTSFFSGYYNFEFAIPFKIKTTNVPGEIIFNGKKLTYEQLEEGKPSEALSFSQTLKLGAYSDVSQYVSSRWRGRINRFSARLDKEIDFFPALFNGIPCMFDKVSKQPFYNSGTGAFIVGLTLAQARKLGKLPAGGGTLTVSLPSNWQEDEGVQNAKSEADAKGWQITVRTYEAEAGAAATFALRRIWVRKTQDEYGSYIAADGSRWSVDWCVDIWGADPQELGYEPFRSIDAALAYWELEPYVYPEEELLTVQ